MPNSRQKKTIHDRLIRAVELQTGNQPKVAEEIYLQILKEDPHNADAKHLLGLIRSEEDLYEESIELITEAICINPDASAFHHNIAGIYRRLGDITEAERQFREAIRLKPDYGEAYQGLAEVVKFDKNDPLLTQILQQLDGGNLDAQIRCYFHFAAGKIYDDIGEYADAFQQYQRGNKAAGRDFDGAAHRQRIKDTIYIYSRDYVKRRAVPGNDSEIPVFVVGMPRSGTTLIEQILASHSAIYGAGELNDMKAVARTTQDLSSVNLPYPNCIPQLTTASLRRLATTYLKRVVKLADDRKITRVVDKHPLNFQFLGLIFDLFPRAKVIHTRRDPLDTCLSCFFQNFTKGQDYSFDLKSLAHFFNDYKRLMEHWEQLYPERILAVDYESVIENQEAESRRMIEFCNLEWQDSCLQFYKTERVVKTASFMQVRQPIYKSSQGRWKRYADQLREVAMIIGAKVDKPVTISASQAWLRSQP